MPRAGACGPQLCAGLALRVASSGVKTFSLHYGPSAKRVRMTLGRYPRVTLARARTMALDALARVHVGEDPRRTAAANVADLAAAYLAEYVRPNLRSCRDVERRFKKDVLPAIGTVPLADLHKRDINRVISPIVQRGRQEQAGRVFKDLRAMLRWGVERGDLDTNPANGVRKPASRPPRERVLSDGEIAPAA